MMETEVSVAHVAWCYCSRLCLAREEKQLNATAKSCLFSIRSMFFIFYFFKHQYVGNALKIGQHDESDC